MATPAEVVRRQEIAELDGLVGWDRMDRTAQVRFPGMRVTPRNGNGGVGEDVFVEDGSNGFGLNGVHDTVVYSSGVSGDLVNSGEFVSSTRLARLKKATEGYEYVELETDEERQGFVDDLARRLPGRNKEEIVADIAAILSFLQANPRHESITPVFNVGVKAHDTGHFVKHPLLHADPGKFEGVQLQNPSHKNLRPFFVHLPNKNGPGLVAIYRVLTHREADRLTISGSNHASIW